jgi:hypothetical protein
MAHDKRGRSDAATPAAQAGDADPNRLVNSTDAQLDEIFRRSTTLPLKDLMNAGGHRIDYAARTIFNDEHWKGWLPQGLPIRDLLARLSTGYAKRFWKGRGKVLGETRYVEGRVLVNHELEDLTIDRVTNDLQPGRYVLLKYTDAVFENVFYDVMRALDNGVIIYRGYSGRFPDGKRGFTGLLMRGYTFAQLGVRDHRLLFRDGKASSGSALRGTWRVDAITTANLPIPIATLSVEKEGTRCEPLPDPATPIPPFILDHFRAEGLESELRVVDDRLAVGKWTTDLRGSYAKLLLVGSPGLFHAGRDQGKGRRRFTMHYSLSRS